MLSKEKRLRAAEVCAVLAEGKSAREVYISAKYVQNKGFFRSAAVVSKKVARGAVERNRLRRSVYAALRQISPSSGGMAVFFVQKVPQKNMVSLFAHDITRICSKLFS